MIRRPPKSPPFPYTTLFRSSPTSTSELPPTLMTATPPLSLANLSWSLVLSNSLVVGSETDRKSTRLNSSHLGISYAVFCLIKKELAQCDHQVPQVDIHSTL